MQFLLTSNLFQKPTSKPHKLWSVFFENNFAPEISQVFFGEFLVVLCLERVHLASSLGFLCTLYNISLTISVLPVDKLTPINIQFVPFPVKDDMEMRNSLEVNIGKTEEFDFTLDDERSVLGRASGTQYYVHGRKVQSMFSLVIHVSVCE